MVKTDINNLILELQSGSNDAFSELYKQTSMGVYGVIYSVIKEKSLAEDLMQDSYIKINSSVQSYKAGTNGVAWILTIAKNTALNEYKRRARETAIDVNENANMFGQYDITDTETPLLDLAKRVLKEQEYEIVTLHLMSGMTHSEIARQVNRPCGTIMWAYNNAIAKLKKAYTA